jgi:hypothetical protein
VSIINIQKNSLFKYIIIFNNNINIKERWLIKLGCMIKGCKNDHLNAKSF